MKPTIFILLIFTNSLMQSNPQLNLHENLDKRFQGGTDAFFKFWGTETRYVRKARENCVVGVAIFTFQVDCEGKLQNITFKNKLGSGLDEEVERVLKLTENQWLKCKDNQEDTFELSVKFVLGNTQFSGQGEITITGYQSGSQCPNDEDLIKQLKKVKKKNQTANIISLYEELIRRNPHNQAYREELQKIK
jgi:hypothetical protein